ncbi:MAG: ligand-binding sensor domain-containing protein, partial [Crocinitomicaceae bacterium]
KGKAIKNIKYLDVKQGTSSSYIWDVYHDTKNQIWMGTNGGGVSVYTGDKFRHFNEDCGLSNNFVWCIEEDQHGNMWFGTLGQGVCMFDGNNFYQLGLKEGFKATDINFIYEDNGGLVWIGSKENGLFIYNGKKAHKILTNQIGDSTRYIYEDARNRKWIATERGIHIIDKDSITQITTENGLKSHNINKILEDKNGNTWIAYDDQGIDVYDGVHLINYNTNNYLTTNHIYDLALDPFDNIWIASYGGGLCQFNGTEFIWLDETNGLSGEHVICVTTDSTGNIWAGTDGDGLDIININSFQNLNEGNGLINDYIYAMCVDQKQQIWFGGEEGELMLHKNNEYFTFSQFDDIIDKQINKIYEDSKGRIWIAAEDQGVIKISDNRVEIFSKENGLISNQIYEIIEDKNGLLWFGSSQDGLCSFDDETFTHYNESNGLYHNQIRTSSMDLNGNLYFGTWGGGVIKYDGSYFHHITEAEGLNSSIIISSYNDSKGNIWFGSLSQGACMFDGSDFYYFSNKTGLSDNKIWSIVEDTTTKSIWIGTENGLNQMQNIDSKFQDLKCMTYNWNDGIRCVDFLKSSAIIDQSGVLWWGTGKGLTKLMRQDILSNISQPLLRLRNISINNKYIDYLNPPDSLKSNVSFSSVHKFENVPNNLVLSHDNNHLTFDYSGINWSKPQGITYSYMLDGLDPTWSPPTYETHADFTNIPHGSYTFKVKSRISGGKWSKPLEYNFTINPPWWATWWARSAYVILSVISIWLFILQRTRRLKLRQLKLVKEIKKATKEIRERKDEVERQKNSNLEMSKRILEQDKQLILNATANTVAHTLNSPLGAIKAGAESINHIYNDLFSNIIQKCSVEQIAFGYEYAKKFNGQQLESGKELRLRIKKVIDFLSNKYSITGNEAHEISIRISKIYLEPELTALVDFVLLQENRIEVLDM